MPTPRMTPTVSPHCPQCIRIGNLFILIFGNSKTIMFAMIAVERCRQHVRHSRHRLALSLRTDTDLGTFPRVAGFLPMGMRWSTIAACMLLTSSSIALAQAPPKPERSPAATPRGDKDCTPTRPAPRRDTTSPSENNADRNQDPLGDKLADSNGVLCPPNDVDPQMHVPAPNTGKMPVIPPPGSPGGDPSIRPK